MVDGLFQKFSKNLLIHGLEFFKLYYAEYDGICMNNVDPKQRGRVVVKVPDVSGNDVLPWAWPQAPWSGKNSGLCCIPDIGDPVTVTFQNGNMKYPRYKGGFWNDVDGGDNYIPDGVYDADGNPTGRVFRTKAGHELSFSDKEDYLTCKFIWADKSDPGDTKYTFIAFTKDGGIQGANHKGSFFELRATDNDVLNMIADANGNRFIQDKYGTKVADSNGNLVELKNGVVQIMSTDGIVVSSKSVALETGGVTVGPAASAIENSVKGTSFKAWWDSIFSVWLRTLTVPTGVGPSGPPIVPPPPMPANLFTDKLKVQ